MFVSSIYILSMQEFEVDYHIMHVRIIIKLVISHDVYAMFRDLEMLQRGHKVRDMCNEHTIYHK